MSLTQAFLRMLPTVAAVPGGTEAVRPPLAGAPHGWGCTSGFRQ